MGPVTRSAGDRIYRERYYRSVWSVSGDTALVLCLSGTFYLSLFKWNPESIQGSDKYTGSDSRFEIDLLSHKKIIMRK